MQPFRHPSHTGPILGRDAGFTVLELIVATAVTVSITLGLLTVFRSSGTAYAELSAETTADSMVLNVTSRLDDSFRYVLPLTVSVPDPITVRFATSEGWDGTAPIASPQKWLTVVDDGLYLDDVPLLEDITFFEAAIIGPMLTITLELSVPVDLPGGTWMINRRITFQHRLVSGN